MGLLSWLGLAPDQENLQAGLDADAANAALSNQLAARGNMTQADLLTSYQHYETSYDQLAAEGAVTSTAAQGDWAFLQATPAGESAFVGTQIDQTVSEEASWWKKFVTGAVLQPFKFIPWWLWILALLALGGYVFVTLGGLPWAKKKFALS